MYVVWEDDTDDPTRDISFTMSGNEGVSFGLPVNLSNSPGDTSNFPAIAASGANVYVAWVEISDIAISVSTDGGASFDPPINLSNTGNVFASPSIAVAGSNVYVVWEDGNDIFLAKSSNSGTSFGSGENISDNPSISLTPQVASVRQQRVHRVERRY